MNNKEGKDNKKHKDKKLVVLPLDDNSKEISQILSNDTARKILELLAEKPMTQTEIAANLLIPITTAQYNIQKLEKAGLIKVVGTKQSEKNVEMKIYAPEEKFIVIVPKKVKKEDAINSLKKMLPFLAIFVLIIGIGFTLYGLYLFEEHSGSEFSEKNYQTITENIVPGTYTYEIKKFSSIEELTKFISSTYIAYSTGYKGATIGKGFMKSASQTAPSPPKGALTKSDGYSGYEFSTTNIQVQGVDEADIVKNDGKYIYAISKNKIFIVEAYPAENAKILSKINFDENERPIEIFINKDNLIVFVEKYEERQKTAIKIYDISDKKNPELVKNLEISGNYFDSRMIGDYAYVIVNKPIYYYPCAILSNGEVNLKCIRERIEIPEIIVDNKSFDEKFPEIYYWDFPDSSYQFSTIVSINVKNGKINKKIFVIGNTQNIYVSQENIYVTATKFMNDEEIEEIIYSEAIIPNLPEEVKSKIEEIEKSNKSTTEKNYEKILEIKNYIALLNDSEIKNFEDKIKEKIKEKFESRERTIITKIKIKDGDIEIKNIGSVPGNVLNQFSMDEYKGNFRIATTTQKFNDEWKTIQANNLYVLNDDLKIIGKITDIAPGEKIYAARFMNDRCYFVTFRKVDPLFVIDLKDPKNPKILGKLKIPGYSDYLHPYDENHIIGIGKEAIPDKYGDFAWYQGVKISLFDISDVENPKEISKYLIGDRGTESEALHDHKAFLFSKSKNLLVIPILLAEIKDKEKIKENPWQYGEYTFQGAYVFNINLKEIKFKGRITHINEEEFKKFGEFYYDPKYSIRRSLYIDDVLYTISEGMIKAHKIETLEEIKGIKLNN